jgi:hypothetical protein
MLFLLPREYGDQGRYLVERVALRIAQ